MKLSDRERRLLTTALKLLEGASEEEIEIDLDIDLHHDSHADLEIDLGDDDDEEHLSEATKKVKTLQQSKILFRSWKRLSGI